MSAIMSKIGSVTHDVANAASVDMQPTSTEEWIIHTFVYSGAVEIYYTTGATSMLVDSDTGAGSMIGIAYHCSATSYYSIKNVSGGVCDIGFDGIISQL